MDRKYRIEYLPSAIEDLEEIIEYIQIDSPKAALNLVNKIDEVVSRLQDFPELGVVPKDRHLKKLGYRLLIIGNYLVFYVLIEDTVEIRRVVHGSRNYKFLL
jgi:toxin ParE1/3/4